MSDFSKKSAKELKDLLAGAGVEVPGDAKKADLVKLAETHLDKGKDGDDSSEVKKEEVKNTGEYDDHAVAPEPPAKPAGKDLDKVGMEDCGFSPTGRYEAVQIAPGAWRVFGPQGQKVSPVLQGKAKLSNDPQAPGELLEAHGRAYHIAGAHNTHLMKSLGNKVYNAIVKKAQEQGFPR